MSSFTESEEIGSQPSGLPVGSGSTKQVVTEVTAALVDDWFVEQVLPLEPALMRMLRNHWRLSDELEDFRQDIYVRIYNHALRQGFPDNAAAFLFATARNLIVDSARRSRLVSMESVSDFDFLAESNADELSPERIVSAREEIFLLQAAINDLPPRCRDVVKLRKIEGCSQRTIAERLGVTESTVEKHLKHGLFILAQTLYEQGIDVLRRHTLTRQRNEENDA